MRQIIAFCLFTLCFTFAMTFSAEGGETTIISGAPGWFSVNDYVLFVGDCHLGQPGYACDSCGTCSDIDNSCYEIELYCAPDDTPTDCYAPGATEWRD
jgi:hypothetical protein